MMKVFYFTQYSHKREFVVVSKIYIFFNLILFFKKFLSSKACAVVLDALAFKPWSKIIMTESEKCVVIQFHNIYAGLLNPTHIKIHSSTQPSDTHCWLNTSERHRQSYFNLISYHPILSAGNTRELCSCLQKC